MPIPFAHLSSDDEHVWNLQFYFWENAIEHFNHIAENDYLSEGVFEVDACMVIVLASTSLTQLLGQNFSSPGSRVPSPNQLFCQLIDGVDLAAQGFAGLDVRFNELIETYDCIRHFGLSKHDQIREIDREALCDFMTTAQDVWKLTAAICGSGYLPLFCLS